MSNGFRTMVINTRERAVSTDIDRSQQFAARDVAEIWRRLLMPSLYSWEYGSFADTLADDSAAIGAPLGATVLNGLVVLPQAGTLSLFVSPGAVWLDDVDGAAGSSDPAAASPDDSRYKLVADPGIIALGALLMTASGGGGARIDVIECRRATTILETANRDIYDPATGLFTPALVTKVVEGRLVYRVRLGTPGAGLPAMAQGWLPLCIASVPNGAANVDAVTFWDVRPLATDRFIPPTQTLSLHGSADQANVVPNEYDFAPNVRLFGFVSTRFNTYAAGGGLTIGSAGYIDVNAAANKSSTYAHSAGFDIWYLYALFPGFLPRWVRYLDAPASPRVPFGPRGVLTVSQTGPDEDNGLSNPLIAPPTATGLGGTAKGVLLTAGSTDSGGNFHGVSTSGKSSTLTIQVAGPVAVPSGGTAIDQYTLVINQHFPASAKEVLVQITTRHTSATPGTGFTYSEGILVLQPTTLNPIYSAHSGTRFAQTDLVANHFTSTFMCWVKRPIRGLSNGYSDSNLVLSVGWAPSAGITGRDQSSIAVVGWRLFD